MSHPRLLLDKLGISPRKRFSQNFLLSPHWATKLVEEATSGNFSEVWEVGPGLGALTRELIETAHPLKLFEIDRALCNFLREQYPGTPIFEGDFLDEKWTTFIQENSKIHLLSNVPYHVSSPLLFSILPKRHFFPKLVLTFQKEFAERVVAPCGSTHYGGLSVTLQSFFEARSLGTLSQGAFYPRPEIESAAIVLTPKESLLHETDFPKFVRVCFSSPRKKLLNNLKRVYPPEATDDAFLKLSLDKNTRAEELSPEIFASLAKALSPC